MPVRQWREDSEIFGNLDTTVIGLGFFWSFGFLVSTAPLSHLLTVSLDFRIVLSFLLHLDVYFQLCTH